MLAYMYCSLAYLSASKPCLQPLNAFSSLFAFIQKPFYIYLYTFRVKELYKKSIFYYSEIAEEIREQKAHNGHQ